MPQTPVCIESIFQHTGTGFFFCSAGQNVILLCSFPLKGVSLTHKKNHILAIL